MTDSQPASLLLDALRRLGQESRDSNEAVALFWHVAYRWLCPRLRAAGARQPADDAADIAQEVALRVVRCHATCRATQEHQAVAWVLAITRNLLADHRRRETRREATLVEYREDATIACGAVNYRVQTTCQGHASLLGLLRGDDLTVVQLRLGAQATWREIGEELGCSPAAAKRRFQRLVARLQRAALVGQRPNAP